MPYSRCLCTVRIRPNSSLLVHPNPCLYTPHILPTENCPMARSARYRDGDSHGAPPAGRRKSPTGEAWMPGLALGYRRNKTSGAWLARRWDREKDRYREHRLGLANDAQDADGLTVLSYRHAQEAAREWWKGEESRAQGLEPAERNSYLVGNAVLDYLAARHRRGSRGVSSDRSYAEARILPELGGIELSRLTTARIRHWHTDLAIKPKFVRTKAGATARAVRPVDLDDPEAVRARWSSANRVLTVLKAALNYAFQEGEFCQTRLGGA